MINRRFTVVLALLAIVLFQSASFANHSWAGYHWGRTTSSFVLKVGDNVDSNWDSYLNTTISDWTKSTVLDMSKVAGGSRNKRCSATAGRVEVCNNTYGNNGWLGIASVWASGTHITQGTVKLNDTYFNTAQYNSSAWRNLVSCQEVGHTIGLDHQDENFTNPNLGTCMDYTNDPSTNQHPNSHDYQELQTIYQHLDSANTYSKPVPPAFYDLNPESMATWGRPVGRTSDGRSELYVLDFGNGYKIFTFVTWARATDNDQNWKTFLDK